MKTLSHVLKDQFEREHATTVEESPLSYMKFLEDKLELVGEQLRIEYLRGVKDGGSQVINLMKEV